MKNKFKIFQRVFVIEDFRIEKTEIDGFEKVYGKFSEHIKYDCKFFNVYEHHIFETEEEAIEELKKRIKKVIKLNRFSENDIF